MSKSCIISTVKSKIKGNATSFIEKENEIFIPVSKKFTLKQTRVIAQDKVNKINKEYLSEKFGAVVSLNTSYTDGTGINIHPSQRLVEAYEVKEGNKTIEEVNRLDFFNGDEALLEQEEKENLVTDSNQAVNQVVKPGVAELFESNSEFAAIGTQEQYSQYLESLNKPNTNPILQGNQEAVITPNDKIVFGHPGIGKTFLRESGRTDVIDFDSDYKSRINEKFGLEKGFKARNDFQKNNKEEYQKAVRELWEEAKQEAFETGKQLFASDMILLREFANDFDKVITMSKETFVSRAKQRNDYTPGAEGTEGWKQSLDTVISNVDKSKVVSTDKYLSDLFTNTQQEQVKKFAELQERLNNKEFLEGAKFAFESSEELQQFGTQEQYNDFIARVSLGILKNPTSGEYNYTSQVKDIVYHGVLKGKESYNKILTEGFRTTGVPKFQTGISEDENSGIYFSTDFKLASDYGTEYIDVKDDGTGKRGMIVNHYIIPAIVNIKNLSPEFGELSSDILRIKKNDPTIDGVQGIEPDTPYNVTVVFEPEQIYVLGGKNDIQGFKEFVQEEKDDLKPFIDESNKVGEQIRDVEDNIQFSLSPEINYQLKAIEILNSDKAKQVFDKGNKNGWDLNKILTELQVPKEQKKLVENIYNNKINDILKTLEKNCE